MKPRMLRFGDDLIHLADVQRISHTSQVMTIGGGQTQRIDGVEIRFTDGREVRYIAPDLWPAVEAWLNRECEIVTFELKQTIQTR